MITNCVIMILQCYIHSTIKIKIQNIIKRGLSPFYL
nr:MAG TPA_asm: hypothetical protein [Caudoviricetes sp.]